MSITTWAVDVSAWDRSAEEWHAALALLPVAEQQQVQRFVFAKDQHLALASRLLQRTLIHHEFGMDWDAIAIVRTPEGKPYWQRPLHMKEEVMSPASWNYNVSHHGTLVAIAAHATALVGVDVVSMTEQRRRYRDSSDTFFRAFTNYFTPYEWTCIRASSSSDDQLDAFAAFWSLKEAYIKAIGIGLGFPLLRAEFRQHDAPNEWQLALDQNHASQWRFHSTTIAADTKSALHRVSIALGPVSELWHPETSSIFPSTTCIDQANRSPPTDSISWTIKTLDDLIASKHSQ